MYAVIGATGNTGNVVAKALLAHGQKVRVIGRTSDRLQLLAKLGAEPFVADITDAGALVRAFTGAQAAYVIVSPNVRSENVKADSERVSDALALAIEKARIKHAVALSSIGADKTEKTGSVIGLTPHGAETASDRMSERGLLARWLLDGEYASSDWYASSDG